NAERYAEHERGLRLGQDRVDRAHQTRLRPSDDAGSGNASVLPDRYERRDRDGLDALSFERGLGLGTGPAIRRPETAGVDLHLVAGGEHGDVRPADEQAASYGRVRVGVGPPPDVDGHRRSRTGYGLTDRPEDGDRPPAEVAVDPTRTGALYRDRAPQRPHEHGQEPEPRQS